MSEAERDALHRTRDIWAAHDQLVKPRHPSPSLPNTERAGRRSALGVGRRPTDSLNSLHRMTGSTSATMALVRAPSCQPPPRANPNVTWLAGPYRPLWTVWVTCVLAQTSASGLRRQCSNLLLMCSTKRLIVPLKSSSLTNPSDLGRAGDAPTTPSPRVQVMLTT